MLFALLIALVKEFSFPHLVHFLRKHPEWLRILASRTCPTKPRGRSSSTALQGMPGALLTALVREFKAGSFLKEA